MSEKVLKNIPLTHLCIALARRSLSPMLWPYLYRYAAREVRQFLLPKALAPSKSLSVNDEAELARDWCQERATTTEDALIALGLLSMEAPFRLRYEAEIGAAQRRISKCPFRLAEMNLAGSADTDLLHAVCYGIEASRVLETGVALGWSSLAILATLKDRPGARLISIDMPYLPMLADQWVGIAVPEELTSPWVLYRMPDRIALPRALTDHGSDFDLCHYDSDKSRSGREWAYPRLWQALRPGGILISDDIGDNLAWRDFCQALGKDGIVTKVEEKYIGLLRKPQHPQGPAQIRVH